MEAKAIQGKAANNGPVRKSKARKASAKAHRARAKVNSAGELLAAIESRSIRELHPTAKQHMAIRTLAQDVFGEKSTANVWMSNPVNALSNQIPEELIESGQGAAKTIEFLMRLEYGVFT